MLHILDITAPDINNGLGCRVTLWVSGCKHKCKGCHNKWTWKYNQGRCFETFRREIFEELANWLDKPYISGLTLSGGDPLCQNDDALQEIITIINWFKQRYPQKNIWLYTGYTIDEIYESDNKLIKEITNLCDVIVDGPYIESQRDISGTPFRGSKNQNLIYNMNANKKINKI